MSLNFNLAGIKNYKEVCYFDSSEGQGAKKMSGVTNTLIWDTMVTGLNQINEKNIGEWLFRLYVLDKIFPRPEQITRQDLVNHIGLTTNASSMTRAAFKKKAMSMLEGEALRHVDRIVEHV